ncbi:TPA: glycosyltransferase, partial [Klebsiella aerogenes]|nr:glycosyltransferase [Klebsiella aerogenes]
VLCVSQGRIESGNIGIIAAKLARRRVISYIPMVHTHIEMSGKKTINVIKDLLCKPLYKFPDCFITISNAVKKELSNHTSGNIKVVENFVQQKEPVQIADVPPALYDEYIYKIVIPGRLINKQKGQLDFIQSFEKIQRKVNKKLICYIIGDGPDYELFSNEIVTRKLEGSVILLGNRNDLLGIMKKSNLIVL